MTYLLMILVNGTWINTTLTFDQQRDCAQLIRMRATDTKSLKCVKAIRFLIPEGSKP